MIKDGQLPDVWMLHLKEYCETDPSAHILSAHEATYRPYPHGHHESERPKTWTIIIRRTVEKDCARPVRFKTDAVISANTGVPPQFRLTQTRKLPGTPKALERLRAKVCQRTDGEIRASFFDCSRNRKYVDYLQFSRMIETTTPCELPGNNPRNSRTTQCEIVVP